MVKRLPSPFDENEFELWNVEFQRLKNMKTLQIGLYRKYPNFNQVEIISDPIYFVRILFER